MHLPKHLPRTLIVCLLVLRAAVSPALGQHTETCPPPVPALLTALQVQEGMTQARDRGFLWRLTKGDHSSYLYGTIHMAKRDWAFPGPKILQALREIDTVALEIDPLDPQIRQELRSGLPGSPAKLELPAALKERIERRMAFECLPPETFYKLTPMLQVLALSFLAGRREGLEPAYGIDAVLAGIGRGAKKKVVSLETTETQLRAGHAATGGGSVASLEKALDELESGRAAANLARLATTWAEGDLVQLQRYAQAASASRSETGRSLSSQVLDDPNRSMATGIDVLHSSGSKVFAALGSLHMVGPLGLPSLMSEKGYKVESIPLTP